MSGSGQWNLRNPAVKRIVQELKEIQRDDNPDILAEALEVRRMMFARLVSLCCVGGGKISRWNERLLAWTFPSFSKYAYA